MSGNAGSGDRPCAGPRRRAGAGPIERRKDYSQRSWDSSRFIVPLLRDAIGGVISQYACEASAGAKCLDIGCGRQPFRAAMEQMGYAYRGLDAEQNVDGTVDFIGLFDRPLPPEVTEWGPVDFVLCTEVLEHVADWGTAFANLRSVLKPGGRALVTCPFVYPLHEEPFDFWRPTRHALRSFAENQGLILVAEMQLGGFWDVLGTVVGTLDSHPPLGRGGRLGQAVGVFSRKAIRRLLLAVTSSRVLRWAAPYSAPLYLSNVAVLQRVPPEITGGFQ